MLRKLFARATRKERELPPGRRIYAIGDIHGCADLLRDLLDQIEADDSACAPADTTLVFLGDLVDRGPDSHGVVELALSVDQRRDCVFLMGNHEEVMLTAYDGDRRAAALFSRIGGRETMLSYGVPPAIYAETGLDDLAELMRRSIPAEHIAFLRGFSEHYAVGDYVFAHAGIRPGIPLEEQDSADLRWIRREFLEDGRDHGALIVHGHTITPEVDDRGNRLGIDTGAYASGRLTAVALEGTTRRFLTASRTKAAA